MKCKCGSENIKEHIEEAGTWFECFDCGNDLTGKEPTIKKSLTVEQFTDIMDFVEPEEYLKDEITIYFYDEDQLAEEYCKKEKCKVCDGLDENGEPNGYGCSQCEDYVMDNIERLIENSNEMEFISLSDYTTTMQKQQAEIESYQEMKRANWENLHKIKELEQQIEELKK